MTRYRTILRNPRARVLFSAVFIEAIAIFGVFPHLAPLIEARGEGGLGGGHRWVPPGPGDQPRERWLKGTSFSGSGSLGSPSTRSAMMLRWISEVPPAMEVCFIDRKS